LKSLLKSNARVVFFSGGTVGRRVVQFALDFDQSMVAGIVGMPGDLDLARLMQSYSMNSRYVEFDSEQSGATAAKIRALGGNIFVLAWWPTILKDEMLNLGQDMTLNLHPSLLPFGRGKDPNFWALVENTPFGVSIHHVTAEIDAGEIAFQREIAYTWEDTGKTLYEKAVENIVDLFCTNYPRIVNFDVPRDARGFGSAVLRKRSELDRRSLIDLEQTYRARDLLNLLRARTFEPHPGCRFFDNDQAYEARVTIRKVTG
jgi:methionyl-tRNA formyltransferase